MTGAERASSEKFHHSDLCPLINVMPKDQAIHNTPITR
jgi:hypothetical protein